MVARLDRRREREGEGGAWLLGLTLRTRAPHGCVEEEVTASTDGDEHVVCRRLCVVCVRENLLYVSSGGSWQEESGLTLTASVKVFELFARESGAG